MKIVIEKPVVIITPTIGNESLKRAITSVHEQTYENIRHLIVIDGTQYFEPALKNVLIPNNNSKITILPIPYNTGAGGFYGHRIYASIPHLVDEDYVVFLDEDNWFEKDHVSSLVETLETSPAPLDWVYSLRNVYLNDQDGGGFLAEDNCEAIGKWPIAWYEEEPQYLVDTSAYLFRREFIVRAAHVWNHGWGADRNFLHEVKDKTNFETSGKHTLNYTLPPIDKAYGGNKGIFAEFNKKTLEKYGGTYPWVKT